MLRRSSARGREDGAELLAVIAGEQLGTVVARSHKGGKRLVVQLRHPLKAANASATPAARRVIFYVFKPVVIRACG
jgi:hypothetical protein